MKNGTQISKILRKLVVNWIGWTELQQSMMNPNIFLGGEGVNANV